jgi:uncharacterized protein involved in cysteine biosynthesis
MEQKVIDEMQDINEGLKREIKKVNDNVECLGLGLVTVGLLVGYGVALINAIWIMFGCLFILYVFEGYRENKYKSRR